MLGDAEAVPWSWEREVRLNSLVHTVRWLELETPILTRRYLASCSGLARYGETGIGRSGKREDINTKSSALFGMYV